MIIPTKNQGDKWLAIENNKTLRPINNNLYESIINAGFDSSEVQVDVVKNGLNLFSLSRQYGFEVGGSANSITLTSSSIFNNLPINKNVINQIISFKPLVENTGAVNIDLDTLGNIALKQINGNVVLAGQLNPTQYANILFDGTDYILLNPFTTSLSIDIFKKIILSNNSIDSNRDIDFTEGYFYFNDFSGGAVLSSLTKQLDNVWQVGTNQGMLDTGTIQANTWYYCYAIYNVTTGISDVIASIDNVSPSLPTGYTKYKYIGACLTDGSANIITGKWNLIGNKVQFNPTVNIIESTDTVFTTTEKSILLTVPNIKVMPIFSIFIQGNKNAGGITDINYYTTINQSNHRILANGGGSAFPHCIEINNLICSDSTLRYTSGFNFTAITTTIFNNGYIDLNI